jgi:predicted DNA-binding transcriptional regulator YafY
LHVTERTVHRDLETFQTAGFPLEETVEAFEATSRGRWGNGSCQVSAVERPRPH